MVALGRLVVRKNAFLFSVVGFLLAFRFIIPISTPCG